MRSDPVSERAKAFVSNIMNISIYRKIDQFKEKFRAFSIAVPHKRAKMVASLCVRQQNEEEHYEVREGIVIIFGITMVGELLNKFIPLPVPAGVYGLFILLGGLCSGIIKLSDVEVTGNLLLDLMPVMFIPAAVGIIDKIEELKLS
mgnify:CR=1 FL=1